MSGYNRSDSKQGIEEDSVSQFGHDDDEFLLQKKTNKSSSDGSTMRRQTGWEKFKDAINPGFPSSVKFIIANELAERFSYYGMKAVLILYFTNAAYLDFDKDRATAMYHVFVMFCYMSPLFGGIISDSYWGKYKTILILSVVYCLGNAIVSITSIPGVTGDPPHWWGALLGLSLIAVGTGGIKPCVSSFGGDQFQAGQERQLSLFFSLFYFAINTGSFLSMMITPKLRSDVKCFDRDQCFPLAFGVPAILMFVATIVFIFGTNRYRRLPPQGNVIVKVFYAVKSALSNKLSNWRRGIPNNKEHWIEHASAEHPKQLLEDIKALFRVLVIFLPLPVFWTLFDQQGSRWTLQAEQMSGDIGPFGSLEPDQMQAVNAIFILILIPVFEEGVYPLCKKLNLNLTPLRKMGIGMILTAVAFVVAALVQVSINAAAFSPHYDGVLGSRLSLINTYSNSAQFSWTQKSSSSGPQRFSLDSLQRLEYENVYGGSLDFSVSSLNNTVSTNPNFIQVNGSFTVNPNTMYSAFIYPTLVTGGDSNTTSSDGSYQVAFTEDPLEDSLPATGKVSIKFIHASPSTYNGAVTVTISTSITAVTVTSDENDDNDDSDEDDNNHVVFTNITPGSASKFSEVSAGSYYFIIRSNATSAIIYTSPERFSLEDGQIVVFTLSGDASAVEKPQPTQLNSFVYVDSKQVLMLLQVPQYIIMTAGEVMFSITGLEFAYSQAPESMKAVATSAWLLTVAFGNLIVIIIAEAKPFEDQTDEFLFYAGMLGVVAIIFALLARRHKYVATFATTTTSSSLSATTASDDSKPLTPVPDERTPLSLSSSTITTSSEA